MMNGQLYKPWRVAEEQTRDPVGRELLRRPS